MQPIQKIPFYFVRHGETPANVDGLCQGHIDFPLTQKGEAQARHAAEILKPCGIRRLATSSLARAHATALIIANSLGLDEVTAYSSLIERGWGELEGKDNALMFAQEERERVHGVDGASPIAGLETKPKLLCRIADAMNEVLPGLAPVGIVGHGRFFNGLCELLGVPPIRQLENGVPVYCEPNDSSSTWRVTLLCPTS